MDEFDKIRWKTEDSLTPEEADLIVENRDKLNDEEKAAFSNLLEQAEPLPENPLDDQITKAGEEDKEIKEAEKSVEASPASPPVPDNIVTRDTLDTYIEEKRKQWDAEGKTKAEQVKAEEEIKFNVFKEGEVPKDWNDALNKFGPALLDAAEKRILDRLDKKNQEFAENQAKIKASQQEVFKRFEDEFATLARNKMIPDPKEDPDGYKKVHEAIIAIGDQHGKSTVTDAYKLWSIIPEEKGGGFKTGISESKARIEAQKDAAGKIGSGRGIAAPKRGGTPSWASIHNTRIEDLVENRLKQG